MDESDGDSVQIIENEELWSRYENVPVSHKQNKQNKQTVKTVFSFVKLLRIEIQR